jgi:cellulose biosynthesis protein BcsQ
MTGAAPHFIVFANEKGGTGKSTTAVHSAVALTVAGRRVAALDLDTRQRTLGPLSRQPRRHGEADRAGAGDASLRDLRSSQG